MASLSIMNADLLDEDDSADGANIDLDIDEKHNGIDANAIFEQLVDDKVIL